MGRTRSGPGRRSAVGPGAGVGLAPREGTTAQQVGVTDDHLRALAKGALTMATPTRHHQPKPPIEEVAEVVEEVVEEEEEVVQAGAQTWSSWAGRPRAEVEAAGCSATWSPSHRCRSETRIQRDIPAGLQETHILAGQAAPR